MKLKYMTFATLFYSQLIVADEVKSKLPTTLSSGGLTMVTFDDGILEWVGSGGNGGSSTIYSEGGNPGFNFRTIFVNHGITFHNNSNTDFVFDYSTEPSVTISIDVKVEGIVYDGNEVSRPFLLELRDYDEPNGNYPWTSVWYKFDDISIVQTGDWTTYSVTIEDTTVTELPEGWGGYGDEDSDINPILPRGRTFANVIENIDEIAFTTFQPGIGFDFTYHDVRIDNIALFKEHIYKSSFE